MQRKAGACEKGGGGGDVLGGMLWQGMLKLRGTGMR